MIKVVLSDCSGQFTHQDVSVAGRGRRLAFALFAQLRELFS
jgi:hypothetical protein